MSALLERLTRLRSQAGARAGAARAGAARPDCVSGAEAAVAVLPGEDAAFALQRLRRLLALRPGSAPPAPPPRALLPLRGEEIAPGLRFVQQSLPASSSAPLLPPRWPVPQPVARERLLCFDSETTGLSGGSGTRAFMLGAADWCDGRLRLRQLYLTAPSGEAAMLTAFAEWLRADTVLVSYNGRSYDAPLLATRYRMQRLNYPLSGLAHVDLLHPTRRRYRGRWENCRLATIERQVLGIVREDDLPGAQAPAAWRDFLRAGHSTGLMRVLEHNRQDVVTLALLLEHLAGCEAPAARLTSA